MQLRPVGAELFHEEGETGRHYEADGRLSQFVKGARNRHYEHLINEPEFQPTRQLKYILYRSVTLPLAVHPTVASIRISVILYLGVTRILQDGSEIGHQPVHVWSTWRLKYIL